MVTIDRKLGGLLPYKVVFFPTDAALAERPKPAHMVRLFWTATELGDSARVVRHHRSATICIDLTDNPDTLLKRISKHTRHQIRQAEKLGDRMSVERNGNQRTAEFLALYNDLARSKPGLLKINERALTRYQGHADTFMAYLDGKPVCGHVLLRDAEIGRARLLYSASRRFDDRETARLSGEVNRFLHWHEICAYKEEGFVTYDLGGIEEDPSNGIAQFKISFGGKLIKEHTYLCAGSALPGRTVQMFFENLSARGRRWRPLTVASSGNLQGAEAPRTSGLT